MKNIVNLLHRRNNHNSLSLKNCLSGAICSLTLAVSAIFSITPDADACTRVLYTGSDNLYVIGRSLDWRTPIPTNLYVYPRGLHKKGSNLPGAVEWVSKYGAVYAVGYDGGVTEGMNERGLVVNGLFCKGTVYENDSTKGRAPMSMSMFVAWILDTCETVDDVRALMEAHDFNLGGSTFDGGTVSALHWGATDHTGATIIFEFDHGDIKVYDAGDYYALANDPEWPAMTAIVDYWNKIGGNHMLPGTVTSADRCVRANYFAHHVEKTADADLGAAICRTVLEYSSVPYSYMIEGEPNLSSTQWRSLSNVRDLRYYFDIVTNTGCYYIDLKGLILKDGAPILKLDTSKNTSLNGNANAALKPSDGFTPMY